MEILRTAPNPWGQEILVGIGWDLMWLVVISAVLFIVVHVAYMGSRGKAAEDGEVAHGAVHALASDLPEHVKRHSFASRAFHWLMSVTMFGLLITAFVPVMGWQFEWVTLHWIAGVALVVTIVYHIVHSLAFQDFWSMWFSAKDLPQGMEELKHALGAGSGAPPKSGKYPFDHQLYHYAAALVTLAAIVTGVLMMVRVDTPFWTRDPYLLSDRTWGLVYVIHGFAGVSLIGLIAGHVYFAIRPEKRWITWSMIRGWIHRDDYLAHHDPERWVVKR
ncbi:MAG: cytochrome b/b6 domain-containing protein [Gemmatimonadota bacterium]|nr:cytochrome b/b6 domain-containing protein [Gemmatimonadota bacterium]MDH5758980.1 cytochrome b/b6 domain-containing protein [Gemmatimonadota bacterium]